MEFRDHWKGHISCHLSCHGWEAPLVLWNYCGDSIIVHLSRCLLIGTSTEGCRSLCCELTHSRMPWNFQLTRIKPLWLWYRASDDFKIAGYFEMRSRVSVFTPPVWWHYFSSSSFSISKLKTERVKPEDIKTWAFLNSLAWHWSVKPVRDLN